MARWSSLILIISYCYAIAALQIHFNFPFFRSSSPSSTVLDAPTKPRIAIVGAGAAGSSAAFWISKAKERFALDVDVDVYERASYVGGRTTTVYPYGNRSLSPIEIGATIFVPVNKNLWRASDEFNLTRRSMGEPGKGLGIWDGRRFLLTLKNDDSVMDMLRVFWRYGALVPYRMNKMVQSMIDRYVSLYSPQPPRWDNIASLASTLGWADLTDQTTSEHLVANGISKLFVQEMVEGSTRVNYGQNADQIHALGGLVSMASEDAVGVEGGSWQIFDQFVQRSGARLFLNTSVLSILPKSSSSRLWKVRSDGGAREYKAVILAAPFHTSSIDVPSSIASQIPPQPYVHLHVTHVLTSSPSPDPAYFGLESGAVPSFILTTQSGDEEPEFNSLSYHGVVEGKEDEYIVKLFSKKRLDDEMLERLLKGQVNWVHRQEWDAYPYLSPTSAFPPVKLDQGLYYVNAFEPFISCMETETVAARNVVDLLLNEEFGAGICGSRIAGPSPTDGEKGVAGEGFVYGWDC